MTQVRILGFIGRKGAGKDTVANIVRDNIPVSHKYLHFAFANRLKKTCATMFGFPDHYFHDQELKERVHPEYHPELTPRAIMEWFGTDVVRAHLGPDFWIERLEPEIREAITKYSATHENITVVVTDVRFENEARMLEKLGATMVYVDADERLPPMAPDAHISESGVYAVRDACENVVIINNNQDRTYLNLHVPFILKLP